MAEARWSGELFATHFSRGRQDTRIGPVVMSYSIPICCLFTGRGGTPRHHRAEPEHSLPATRMRTIDPRLARVSEPEVRRGLGANLRCNFQAGQQSPGRIMAHPQSRPPVSAVFQRGGGAGEDGGNRAGVCADRNTNARGCGIARDETARAGLPSSPPPSQRPTPRDRSTPRRSAWR
jgi:hypothetical protein